MLGLMKPDLVLNLADSDEYRRYLALPQLGDVDVLPIQEFLAELPA